MINKRITIGATLLTILIYILVFIGWQLQTPSETITIQIPGADNRPEELTRKTDDVIIGEFFMKYNDLSENNILTGKWIGFRGKNTDNIVETNETINTSPNDFPILWSIKTGEGHAAPAIYNGRVYVLDYDEKLSSDALRCFSLSTGEELWRRWYRVPIKRNHGFSRTIPAIGNNYIITIGPEGHVMCCDPITGEMKWSIDMKKTYNTEMPFWYTGQCPIVDNDILILAPAGDSVLMAGINVHTGEELWTTPNTYNLKMSHSSIIPMKVNNVKMYVYIGVGGVCGISAEANSIGAMLWNINEWQPSVAAPSAVQISNNEIFVVAGYGTGGAVVKLDHNNNKWTAKITKKHKPNQGISSEQQTPIFYNNMLISVMPKDGGIHRGKLAYYSIYDLENPVWTSETDERFGLGPYIIINNHVFVFKDDGELYVYEINTKSMKLINKQRIIDGVDAWGPMAYADGMLIVRDAHYIKCLKIN
jgi:outer membrane protein assembly factor BamB